MLHITNGDSAVEPIRALGLGGEVLPWRDVLHEGPVPAPATLDSLRPHRARFLAGYRGATAVDIARELEQRDRRLGASAGDGEVALWFEHDLYDQLQLAQVLDHLAGRMQPRAARLTLAQSNDYLELLDAGRLRAMWEQRIDVTDAQLAAARRAWGAFAAADPREIERVLDDVRALPYMRAALARHLEEYPDTDGGLSRTERQALEALEAGDRPLPGLFHAAHHEREAPIFLGDTVFEGMIDALSSGDEPLVRVRDEVALTAAGREVLAGRRDRVETLGIDRWLGGVHLRGRRVPFRWDRRMRRIVAS